MDAIAMVDLEKPVLVCSEPQIDAVIQQCILEGAYINGKQVAICLSAILANYTGIQKRDWMWKRNGCT
jgi:hypothetical protein